MSRILGNKIDPDSYDEVAVQRIMRGDRFEIKPRSVDYQEAIIRLAKIGFSDGQIAYVVQKSRMAVMKIRQRRNAPPAIPYGSNQNCLIISAPTRHRSMK